MTYCKSPTLVEGVRDKVFLELVKLHAGALQEEPDEDEGMSTIVNLKEATVFAYSVVFLNDK